MRLLVLIIFCLSYLYSFSNSAISQALIQLDETITNREKIAILMEKEIADLKQQYVFRNGDETDLYAHYLSLSQSYHSFQFDSAYHYSSELLKVARIIGDENNIAQAKFEFADILISAGLFNEAIDTLKTIKTEKVTSKNRGEYWVLLGRAYFDLESFSQSSEYDKIYRTFGMAAYDSALIYLPKNDWHYHSILAQKYLKIGENKRVIEVIDSIMKVFDLKDDDLAALYMNKAWAFDIEGDKDNALLALIQATISDIKAVKKEAVALLFTANTLFERGDVIRASKYINIALEDSHFYGSGFRLYQISQYLPVIKSQHILTIEDQKKKLLYYVIIVSLLSITVIAAIVLIFKQFSIVREAKNEVDKTNKQLAKINEELAVSNRIKEEYIGYFFSVNTVLLEKLDKFKSSINRKFKRKQYDEIAIELNSLSIPMEKDIVLENFDMVFLKIYPDFVTRFNKLMKEGEEIKLKDGHLLNTELRIFALIRLGIHNPEKIAKILDYSVNTIYAYKNRIKTRSIVSNDEFENEIMKIKHF